MTTDERLERLHSWVEKLGLFTVRELMAELDGLRKGQPDAYNDLPPDGITAHWMLERLAADGRVKRLDGHGNLDSHGTFWRWAEGRGQRATQGSLFG